ncbi:zinc metalloproteinase nas-13-like [Photinus pyralis]|uniref:zinc metalloproteinase nas-13-like n=1 Tax=Photinus pyralis TaxID=7054 RepID=UPI0012672839|nr:zinc metalloproteinase nas-13-like [Photinus pyralis]
MKTLLLLLAIVLKSVASVPLESSVERGNPWENSGKFEGDMVFSRKRNGVIDTYYRWPQARICYTISSAFTQYQADHIRRTYASGFSGTCLKIVECQSCCNGDYVHITNNPDDGCYAIVGRVGGQQQLNLAPGCLEPGTILHEMLHAAGFWHQQSSPERDNYVTINLQNVRDGK